MFSKKNIKSTLFTLKEAVAHYEEGNENALEVMACHLLGLEFKLLTKENISIAKNTLMIEIRMSKHEREIKMLYNQQQNALNKLIKDIDNTIEECFDEDTKNVIRLLDELSEMVSIHLESGESSEDISYVLEEVNQYYRAQTRQMFLTEV